MIFEKKIKVFISDKKEQNKYINKGYECDILNTIEIDVLDLNINSRKIIKAECDYCGRIVEVIYQSYNVNTKNNTEKFCCSDVDCMNKKRIFRNLQKHGVENISMLESVKNKKEETSLLNNGVKYWKMDNKLYLDNLKSGLKINKYKDVYYQGTYELDFLNKYYDKIKIENGVSIIYKLEDKDYIYYPDFYIRELDLIIEIKSSYWFNKNKNKCLAKEEYAKKEHNYLLILDKNYVEFNKII